jgi:hypothetical protein
VVTTVARALTALMMVTTLRGPRLMLAGLVALTGVAALDRGVGPTTFLLTANAQADMKDSDHVYVWNLHGHEQGRADERPVGLVLSEFAVLNGVRWRGWGGAGAVGEGRVSGTWCLPGCLKKPYPASVTLSRVRKLRGARYYTGYTVKAYPPRGGQEPLIIKGDLPTP